MVPKFHALTINDVRRETEDTVSISFEIPSELLSDYHYLSGQYLTLKTEINGEDIRRSYSLCSAPHENEWRVAIKQVPEGKFSTFANKELSKGMTLDVMTPTGNFNIDPKFDNDKSYVLFAAGSGITPILSIAKTILKQEPSSDVTLFYGNRGVNSIIFKEEIEALKNEFMTRFSVIHVLSRESPGTPLLKGRMDNKKIGQLYDAFLSDTTVDEVYVCGPEAMIYAVKDAMKAKGVDASKIHFELFTSPGTEGAKPEKKEISQVESNVKIILDGDSFDLHMGVGGDNILDAAQKAGADLPFACKGGVCCTCKARIIEGTAEMDVNYALEPDEVEAGYILTCQAHPTSDQLIVSFDD